jgi:tetratricopeptide (TPR) repeat protein
VRDQRRVENRPTACSGGTCRPTGPRLAGAGRDDTYEPGTPDRYPAYLDQRVYQGSSGAVYPLPFIDQVSRVKRPRRWDAVHLENEYVRLMVLPELGGRIHIGLDKTRDCDFFYRNDVIKPALAWLHRADLELRRGDEQAAADALERVRELDRTWCFPATADNDALDRLRRHFHDDPVLAALAGHWLYATGRRDEAIAAWEVAAATEDRWCCATSVWPPTTFRARPDLAARYYQRARAAAPDDARLLYEADQLDGRRGVAPAERLATLLGRRDLVEDRDDLSVQLVELLTAEGREAEALDVLRGRAFQPWEGGEGRVLAAWEEAHLSLARKALAASEADRAVEHATAALRPIASLGEARHPLANTADLHLILGDALTAAGRARQASQAWETAAAQQGDFQVMQVRAYSERTAASVTALRRLGRHDEAERLCDGLARYAAEQAEVTARVDYFATSRPTMLLFTEDLQAAHDLRVRVLRAQPALLDDDLDEAVDLAGQVLARDPLNPAARAVAATAASTLDRSEPPIRNGER